MDYFKIYFVILVFLLCSCQASTTNNQEIRSQIKSVLDEQVQAWNQGDIEQYMAGYYQSDSLRFASGGSVNYGWQATLNRYKKSYPDKDAMGTLTFSNLDIRVLSQKYALVFGRWELEREKDHPWGLFTLLFNKTDAGWRIVCDHTSSANDG